MSYCLVPTESIQTMRSVYHVQERRLLNSKLIKRSFSVLFPLQSHSHLCEKVCPWVQDVHSSVSAHLQMLA